MHCGALSAAEHQAVHVEALLLTMSRVGREHKRAVLDQRTSNARPELISVIERELCLLTEVVPGIERIVTKELVDIAMEYVRTRCRHDADHGSGLLAVF